MERSDGASEANFGRHRCFNVLKCIECCGLLPTTSAQFSFRYGSSVYVNPQQELPDCDYVYSQQSMASYPQIFFIRRRNKFRSPTVQRMLNKRLCKPLYLACKG